LPTPQGAPLWTPDQSLGIAPTRCPPAEHTGHVILRFLFSATAAAAAAAASSFANGRFDLDSWSWRFSSKVEAHRIPTVNSSVPDRDRSDPLTRAVRGRLNAACSSLEMSAGAWLTSPVSSSAVRRSDRCFRPVLTGPPAF
jgi:hypothetical protein